MGKIINYLFSLLIITAVIAAIAVVVMMKFGWDFSVGRGGVQIYPAEIAPFIDHVKKGLGEPSSFELIESPESLAEGDAEYLRVHFRAKNAFGGMSVTDRILVRQAGKIRDVTVEARGKFKPRD